MLDDKTKMMLQMANQLTTDDIEMLRSGAPIVPNCDETVVQTVEVCAPTCTTIEPADPSSRGAYERGRTRESKVSTTCVGTERAKHL